MATDVAFESTRALSSIDIVSAAGRNLFTFWCVLSRFGTMIDGQGFLIRLWIVHYYLCNVQFSGVCAVISSIGRVSRFGRSLYGTIGKRRGNGSSAVVMRGDVDLRSPRYSVPLIYQVREGSIPNFRSLV